MVQLKYYTLVYMCFITIVIIHSHVGSILPQMVKFAVPKHRPFFVSILVSSFPN